MRPRDFRIRPRTSTTAIATTNNPTTTGTTIATTDSTVAATFSTVATIGFPNPAVVAVDAARVVTVPTCTADANPPPATAATPQCSSGLM